MSLHAWTAAGCASSPSSPESRRPDRSRRGYLPAYVVELSAPAIETVGLTKLYADTRALDELDLQVQSTPP